MARKTKFIAALSIAFFVASSVHAQDNPGEGVGVDSQTLWPTPGPSNFPTVESADIVEHKNVTFSAVFGYSHKPLFKPSSAATPSGDSNWIIDNAFYTDFLWAFGLFDYFQIGLALPVVLDQSGKGLPRATDANEYGLAGSALRDLRFNIKTRFLGGKATNPDTRGFGLALDLGLAVPTGDEMNFAGDRGAVFFPTAVIDFHKCMFSAALNLGGRFRFDIPERYEFSVGHQGAFGLGLTGHFADRRFLVSGQGTGLIALEGFDKMGVDMLGGLGFVPDESRAITIWATGGLSMASEDFIGAPKARALVGLTYAPGSDGELGGTN